MLNIICPFCSTELLHRAKSCDTCMADISYGKIPQDTLGFIGIGAMALSLVTMNVVPKFGIRHPFIAFFLTIGLVFIVGYWRASTIYKDVISWKRVADPKEGNIIGESWRKVPFELKLRQGFEVYHRERYGYYPIWDANRNEFVVRSAQDRWALWKLFFQDRRSQVMAINSSLDMRAMYLDSIQSKDGA